MPKTKTPTAPPSGTQSMASFVTITKSPKPPKASATEKSSEPSMKEILDERDRKYKSLIVLWAAAKLPKQHAHRMSCQDRWTQGVHHFARLVARGTEPEPDPKWVPLAFPPEHAKTGLTQ